MSQFGFVSDLPLPDVWIREGDQDPVVFTLRQADGTVIDLTGRTVELRLQSYRGDQTTLVIPIAASPTVPRLVIASAIGGLVALYPALTTFTAIRGPYRAYFNILTSGVTPQSVPAERELWIGILGKLA